MTQGVCFWTNLQNVEQSCGSGPEPPDPSGVVEFTGPEGHGSSFGGFRLRVTGPEWFTSDVCDIESPLMGRLLSASSVVVTGIAPILHDPECGETLPEDIAFDPVEFVMEAETSVNDVFSWRVYLDEGFPESGWHYVRIVIDDTYIHYGALSRGGGI